jgi:glycosyltransferase involved in cell wall biosynthesis
MSKLQWFDGPAQLSRDNYPPVSILIASHDRLALLKKAVESALEQDYPNTEVVIVDDGSNDETRRWLKSVSSQNQRLLVHYQDNRGPGSARAEGVKRCRGELICILDSDDRLLRNAVSTIINEFRREPDLDLVYVNIEKRLANKMITITRYPKFSDNRKMITSIMLRPVVPFKHSGTCFRRATVMELGGYDANLPRKIDIDLFLRFLRAGKKVKLIEEPPLVIFQMNKESISRNRFLGIRSWLTIIEKYGTGLWIPVWLMEVVRISLETGKGAIELLRYLRSQEPSYTTFSDEKDPHREAASTGSKSL